MTSSWGAGIVLGALVMALTPIDAAANETALEMDDKDPRPRLLYQELRVGKDAEPLRVQQVSFQVCSELNRQVKDLNVVCALKFVNLKRKNKAAVAFEKCKKRPCFTKTGKALHAELIVLGNVAYDGKQKVMTLYLFDVKRGKYRGRSRQTARDIERLVKTIPAALRELNIPG